ncbi:MAG: ABC transporter permease [Lachnospiraceae bacterium]|nr:ABC transporter permease [Lachnospiraceae bacterium]
MNRNRSAFLLALPTLVALIVLFIVPMGYIFYETIAENGWTDFVNFFQDEFYRGILWTTVRVSLITTLITFLLGYPTAYFMARTKSKLKNVLMIVILFPFLVSAVVRSYGWMVILGKQGLVNQFVQFLHISEEPLKILYTETAVIIGMVHLLLPYMILSVAGVIQNIDPNIEYSAYSLGANPAQTFWKVVLPLSTPGIFAGCTLVFIMSMTSYVTPKLLGGSKFRMMSTMVEQEVNVNFNWHRASAISYILLFAILVILFLLNSATAGMTKRVGGGKNA